MKEVLNKCKISPAALGLSLGIIWGASVFIAGLSAYYFSYGKPFVDAMGAMYIGYEPSLAGSIIGGLFGLVDGLIVGSILAFLYNCFADKWACCKPSNRKHRTHALDKHSHDAHTHGHHEDHHTQSDASTTKKAKKPTKK